MTLLAHRGVTAKARDNSAEALQAVADAVAIDIPLGIETDIRVTEDDLVLNHDPFEGGFPLFNLPYASLQSRLKTDCPIRLSDGLSILRNVPVVVLELKEVGIADRVAEMVLRHCDNTGQPLDAFLFVSFVPRVLAEVKHADPRFKTGQLIEGNLTSSRPTPDRVCLTLNDAPSEEGIALAETMWSVVDNVGADFLSPHWTRLNRLVFELARERGKQILPWSVNNAHLLAALASSPEVNHVVTDFPEMAYADLKPELAHRKLIPLSESE